MNHVSIPKDDCLSDNIGVKVQGHVKITEYNSHEDRLNAKDGIVRLHKRNAIHPENFSILIARGISDRENGRIYTMHFGIGGRTIDPLGNIIYASPNTIGNADLNTPVFYEVVDDNQGAPTGNNESVRHLSGTLFTDVEIRCVVDKNQPFGQSAVDNIAGVNINRDQFTIDEIALKTADGLLVTHIVFSPIQKSSNRILEIVYTLRISIVT